MCVLLFDVFNGCSLVKKSIGKEMSTIYTEKNWRSEKTCWKSKFFEMKIWRNAPVLKSKKEQVIFGGTFILELLSSAVFRLQNRVSDFL